MDTLVYLTEHLIQDSHILNVDNRPTFILVKSDTCGHCKTKTTLYRTLTEEWFDTVNLVTIDTTQRHALHKLRILLRNHNLNFDGTPSLFYYEKGTIREICDRTNDPIEVRAEMIKYIHAFYRTFDAKNFEEIQVWTKPLADIALPLEQEDTLRLEEDPQEDTLRLEQEDTLRLEEDPQEDTLPLEQEDTLRLEEDPQEDTLRLEQEDTLRLEEDPQEDTLRLEQEDTLRLEQEDTLRLEQEDTLRLEQEDTLRLEEDPQEDTLRLEEDPQEDSPNIAVIEH